MVQLVSPTRDAEVLTPVPVTVTLSGDEVFAEVVKLR